MGARRFDPTRPLTWSWDSLNAWLMAPGRTATELRLALRAEAQHRRLSYQLRLQARLNRLLGQAAKRRLLGEPPSGGSCGGSCGGTGDLGD